MEEKVLSMVANDRFGVLNKVTTLFSRKGCRIARLTALPDRNPDYVRITAAVDEPEEKVRQLFFQLEKLEDIIHVAFLEPREISPGASGSAGLGTP